MTCLGQKTASDPSNTCEHVEMTLAAGRCLPEVVLKVFPNLQLRLLLGKRATNLGRMLPEELVLQGQVIPDSIFR